MFLTDLQLGLKAQITDITFVNDMLRRRLIDLGIMEGENVCVRRALPFGGPLTLEAAGQCFAIRRCDANHIRVKLT